MHSLILLIAVLFFPALQQPAGTPAEMAKPVAVAEPRQLSVVVHASAAEIWRLFTSGKAWAMSESSAKVEIDFRLGGTIRVATGRDAVIGDNSTFCHTILAYEPERMIAVNYIAPGDLPAESRAVGENSCSVFLLEPLASDRTRVTVTLVGCEEKGKYALLCDKLIDAQQVIVHRMVNHFMVLRRHEIKQQADDLRRAIAKLAGDWAFEQQTADKLSCGTMKATTILNTNFLAAHTTFTAADSSVQQSHLVIGEVPVVRTFRAWRFGHDGGVSEGEVRLEAPDKLVIDLITPSDRSAGRRIEYTFTGPDELRCMVLDAPNDDGTRETKSDVTYKRTIAKPPAAK